MQFIQIKSQMQINVARWVCMFRIGHTMAKTIANLVKTIDYFR